MAIINKEDLKTFLDLHKNDFIKLIYEEYNKYLSKEQKETLSKLQDDDTISIDLNTDKYKEMYPEIDSTKLKAHGPRTLNDGKIHIYPNNFKELNDTKLKGILMHELLHYIIKPEGINLTNITKEQNDELNSFTTEGLVDLKTRDILFKYNIVDKYASNYSSNVIFLREALNNINGEEEKNKLIFNGSIKDIYIKTCTNTYNSLYESKEARNSHSWFNKRINELSSKLMHGENKKLETRLLNELANHKDPRIGIERISKEKELISKYLSSRTELDKLDSNNYHDTVIHFLTSNKSINEISAEIDSYSKENTNNRTLNKDNKNGYIGTIAFLSILTISCILTSIISFLIISK